MGGITIAQNSATAIQPDMPESAIASGCIDFVLSPEDIAKEIVRIARTEGPANATVRGHVSATAVSGAASIPLRSA